MPLSSELQVAEQLATFGTGATRAASINYDVPLPGAYQFERIVPLNLSQDVFGLGSGDDGEPLLTLLDAGDGETRFRAMSAEELGAFYGTVTKSWARAALAASEALPAKPLPAAGPRENERRFSTRDHAVVEQVIADLKDHALAHLLARDFHAIGAWPVLAALAHILLRWTQLLGLPDTTVRAARTLHRRLLGHPRPPSAQSEIVGDNKLAGDVFAMLAGSVAGRKSLRTCPGCAARRCTGFRHI